MPASLESVLSTDELYARSSRPPDYETENRALREIAQHMADSPRTTLQKLVEVALEICQAGSAGVSLLSKDSGDFYWPAIAGAWKPHIGGGTPRHFGPCGVVLDRNAVQLFTRPERYYPYLVPVSPPAVEALLTPFYVEGKAVGTVWVIAHEDTRQFDAEDIRLIESLSRFAAATYPVFAALDAQEQQSQSLRDINQQLLISSVHQHELTGQAQTAEAARRESAERLSFMAESMPQKIFTAKSNGDVDYFNRQWLEFTGMGFDEIRNWGWTQIVHPDDIGENIRVWRYAIDTGEPFQFVHRLKRADSSYRWHLSRAHAMRDAGGKVSMWIGSNTDIHDQREREEQLRETQKLESIGVLAGGIAHDFNNLLTGILGNASMLASHASDSDRPLLDDVVKASQRAAGLTNQLLAYAGKGRFAITRCDLSELITEMLHLIKTSIPKMVDLDLALHPDLPLIEVDASQIQQVAMNLAINAAEAIGPDGGAVWISTGMAGANVVDGSKPGRSVYMKVRDSGSGMDEATLAKIFDPFFTTKFLGRGLGLAAVSGIIRSHQGKITVESTPGEGSTFTVVLPAMDTYPFKGKKSAPRSDIRIATGTGLILVVDDDAIVRRMAKAALERSGYTVLLAENGLEAVNMFQQRPAEITGVLLDMSMPVMGGEEALRRLRETRADVPVLIASGYSEMVARERFGDTVHASFLQKPFTVEQLMEKIVAL